MKKLILTCLLLSLTYMSNAISCEKYEAQFVGFVSVSQKTQTGCILDIDFDLYNHHVMCPLLIEQVVNGSVMVDSKTCKSIANSHIGGYLSSTLENDVISLEL
jgi:hypothetical protein